MRPDTGRLRWVRMDRTQAERLLLKCAFAALGMVEVNADAVQKNTRSQPVPEKAEFCFIREDKISMYYCLVRDGYGRGITGKS